MITQFYPGIIFLLSYKLHFALTSSVPRPKVTKDTLTNELRSNARYMDRQFMFTHQVSKSCPRWSFPRNIGSPYTVRILLYNCLPTNAPHIAFLSHPIIHIESLTLRKEA